MLCSSVGAVKRKSSNIRVLGITYRNFSQANSAVHCAPGLSRSSVCSDCGKAMPQFQGEWNTKEKFGDMRASNLGESSRQDYIVTCGQSKS